MTICSHAGCRKHAKVQWVRQATDAEASDPVETSNAERVAHVDLRRTRGRLAIAEIDDLKAHTTTRAEATRLTDFQNRLQAEVAAIPDAVLLEPAPSTVAVFACPDHAVDAEKASHVHAADCAVGDCACDTTPPPAQGNGWITAEVHPALAAKGWS